jgi:hypothetical protein
VVTGVVSPGKITSTCFGMITSSLPTTWKGVPKPAGVR